MVYHYLWLSSNPDLAVHLTRANEERSAALYQGAANLWRKLAAVTHLAADVTAWLRRRIRERAALRELSALDDRSLSDIGISRGEILRVARSFGDGIEEQRRPGGDRDAAAPTAKPRMPAWLRGVFDGGRATAAAPAKQRDVSPGSTRPEEPTAAHG